MKTSHAYLSLLCGAAIVTLPAVNFATTTTSTKPTTPATTSPSTLDEFEDTVGVAPSPKKPAQKATRTPLPKKGESGVSGQFPDWSKRNAPDYKPTDEGLDNEF